MKKNVVIGLLLIVSLALAGWMIGTQASIQDYESIHGWVNGYNVWNEWPDSGAFYGSSVKVTIDSTNPSGKHVSVVIVPPYPPFEPYWNGTLHAGQNSGWQETYGPDAPFYVQVNYAGEDCEFWGHIDWHWP